MRESGQLERIVAALERHLRRERVDVGALEAEGAPGVGAVAAVWAVWQLLGLDGWFSQVGAARGAKALEHAVFAMVANRVAAPCSKRRLVEWTASDVVMPEGWSAPSPDQYYRALDAVAAVNDETETHLYTRLCDLANLDLRLVCYDLTSTYFEGSTRPSGRFPSRAFGYSRDHRSDRPQIVIGLLCTSDGIPVAHHVFPGNTNDATTLSGVLGDLAERFAVGRICVVADRGLISAANVEAVAEAGFDHILATKLRRDAVAAQALAAISDNTAWVEIPQHSCRAADITLADGTRVVVVESDARPPRHRPHRRDRRRHRTQTPGVGGPCPRMPGRGPRQNRGSRPAYPRLRRFCTAIRHRHRTGPVSLPLQRRRPHIRRTPRRPLRAGYQPHTQPS